MKRYADSQEYKVKDEPPLNARIRHQ